MPSQKTTSLLHTKLMPPRLPARMVARERLLARLDEGLSRKVSLVSAPTGFGKTTLVRTWIANREAPSAWVTLADKSFDFTFCQAAFKNFSEPVRAIAEMHRVLRPGGTSVISDLRRDASAAEIEREINGMGIGPLNRSLVRWTFRKMLLKSAYSVDEMRAMVAQNPLVAVRPR